MSAKALFVILLALGVFAASGVAIVSTAVPSYAADSSGNDNS